MNGALTINICKVLHDVFSVSSSRQHPETGALISL